MKMNVLNHLDDHLAFFEMAQLHSTFLHVKCPEHPVPLTLRIFRQVRLDVPSECRARPGPVDLVSQQQGCKVVLHRFEFGVEVLTLFFIRRHNIRDERRKEIDLPDGLLVVIEASNGFTRAY